MKVLIKLFIKDYPNIKNLKVRASYGKLASLFGIFLNTVLFFIKFIIGSIANSVSILADAFNNLSDAGSSIISLISFVFSSKPPDKAHPFGHERLEYFYSLVISFIIMYFAITLGMDSFQQILNPVKVTFSVLMIVILCISILIKLYMFLYNRKYGRLVDSSVMLAASTDSIGDVLATSTVLIGMLISHFFKVQLDGYLGILVALFIMKSGYDILKDTVDKLIGEAPNPSFIKEVIDRIMKYDGILGVHDLVVHTYGPGKTFITVHAEVPSDVDILVSHDIIDNIEKDFAIHGDINLVIHMDPVILNDEFTNEMRIECQAMLKEIDAELTLHDFRVVKGDTHNNFIFDVALPIGFEMSETKLLEEIEKKLPQGNVPNYAVVTVDREYIANIMQN